MSVVMAVPGLAAKWWYIPMADIAFFNLTGNGSKLDVVPPPGRPGDYLRIYGGVIAATGGAATVQFKDSAGTDYGTSFVLNPGQVVVKDLVAAGGYVDIPPGLSFGGTLTNALSANVIGFIAYDTLR